MPSTIASRLSYDPEIFDGISRQNLRGYSLWRLVAEMQKIQQEVEDWESIQASGGLCEAELWMAMRYSDCVLAEVRRRESIYQKVQASPKQIEIQAVKQLCQGEEWFNVAERYVPVLAVGGARKFRCHLHGDGRDREASGTLSLEGRWWCFGCNRGGDVFDFLMTYGRLTFGEAAALLGKLYGLGRGNGG